MRFGALRKRARQQRKRRADFSGANRRGRTGESDTPGGAPLLHDDLRAVSLVVQAWTRSEGSEIFVLDMGEPIRILDLAENMIRLAGLVPYEDVEIQFTGLRPGEKLIEEINGQSKGLTATYQDKMHIIREEPLAWRAIAGWIGELEELVAVRREPEIIAHLRKLVPEYNPAGTWAAQPELLPSPAPSLVPSPISLREAGGDSRRAVRRGVPAPPIACEQ